MRHSALPLKQHAHSFGHAAYELPFGRVLINSLETQPLEHRGRIFLCLELPQFVPSPDPDIFLWFKSGLYLGHFGKSGNAELIVSTSRRRRVQQLPPIKVGLK